MKQTLSKGFTLLGGMKFDTVKGVGAHIARVSFNYATASDKADSLIAFKVERVCYKVSAAMDCSSVLSEPAARFV